MSGGWIAFDIPEDVAQKIYDPLGQPIEALHITLAFFDRLTTKQIKGINEALWFSATKQVHPLVGTLDGIGYFPQKDGNYIQWIPVDIPGVVKFRQKLLDRIHNMVQPNTLHDFTPHVTRAYNVPSPTNTVFTKVPIQLSTVSLHSNGDVYTYTLGSSYENLGPLFTSRDLPNNGVHSKFDSRTRRRADRNIDNPDSGYTHTFPIFRNRSEAEAAGHTFTDSDKSYPLG